MDKWDDRYLAIAKHVASWSKDPSTKTGAVVVHPRFGVVSVGFNGLPRGVIDSDERLTNRELKYKIVVHAERNAIIFAQRALTECTMYVHPWMPCAACAGMVIQSGISRVVAPENKEERWQADFALTRELFREAAVDLVVVGDEK